MIWWHYADKLNRMYCVVDGNKKIAMPRYYKDFLYTKADKWLIGKHTAQNQEARKERNALIGKSISSQTKAARDLNAFKVMYHAAEQNRNII